LTSLDEVRTPKQTQKLHETSMQVANLTYGLALVRWRDTGKGCLTNMFEAF